MDLTDKEYVERCRDGHQEDFRVLVDRYQKPLFAYLAALGRLMDLAEDLAGMTGSLRPALGRRVIVTMAGDHGVVAAGVSKYPQEVTPQMVYNIVAGGAGINAIARG